MSSPAVDGGPVQNFVRSLYPGHFYAGAPFLPLRIGFRNLLLLAAVLGLVAATQWTAGLARWIGEWREGVEAGTIPALLLQDGRLSVRGPQPFVRRQADGGAIIIDTTGVYTTVPDSLPGGIFLGADRVVNKIAPTVSRSYELKGYSIGYWLDGPGIDRMKRMAIPFALAISLPIGFLYHLAGNALLAVMLAGATVLVLRTLSPFARFTFREILTTAFFVLTPVAVIFRFLGLLAPATSIRLLPFYPALGASLLLMALRAAAAARLRGGSP